jgi:DNA-binding transcriptional LysR family regulator
MDFKQLRAFLTVADIGNVTRAAQVLNLVQPAVSRQLRLLEEDIGTELFERERHGMVLTEAGRSLVGYARRVMLEIDRARAEVGGASDGVSGLVTVGLLPSTCELLASPLLRAVSEAHPGIRLRIAAGYAGTLAQWLQSGEVDAALLYGGERLPDIQAKPLVEEALWVVGPPSAKLRSGRPVALATLAGRPMILPNHPHGIRTLVDHACAVSRVELTIVVETNDMNVQKRLAIDGHGMTILPPSAVTDEVQRKLATAAPLSEPKISRTISLSVSSSRAIARHVRVVIDTLVQCVKESIQRHKWIEARWLG